MSRLFGLTEKEGGRGIKIRKMRMEDVHEIRIEALRLKWEALPYGERFSLDRSIEILVNKEHVKK